MKKRSMILALASMLGISAAATAVSGFAWFTTQTTASIKAAKFKVGAAQGGLGIAEGAVLNNCSTNAKDDKTYTNNEVVVTPTTDGILADVSSRDGVNFYKLSNIVTTEDSESADFIVENTKPTSSGAWTSKVNSNQMVAVAFQLTVSNTASDNSELDVYLSNSGAIFSKAATAATADPDYSTYYRMAVLDGNTLVYLYANDGTYKGLTIDDKASDGKTFDYKAETGWDGKGAALVPGTSCVNAANQTVVTSTSSSGAVANRTVTAGNLLLVKGLTKAAAKTLTFVVWCEGTSTPEGEVNAANLVDLSFDLAGIAPATNA